MNIQTILQHPEAIRFSENHFYKENWEASGGRMTEMPSGHYVLYGEHGQRILLADPEGHPLHECLWGNNLSGFPTLALARMYLDWGQWVGLKPGGLVNTMSLDLSTRPGWENLTRDHLREMAARAMNTDLETIRFFYRDEDLELQANGQATIRQVKDAFYMLRDGSFEGARFMSCMSRMEWGQIDYLPVVELFLSLLPGTGSATFELIRGLYDDQQQSMATSLRYRGIPAYPSMGAFGLFNAFFTPFMKSGENPRDVFLDVNRSHEVEWEASPEHPVRYVDEAQRISVTIHKHRLQKVTCWDDSSGLSYLTSTSSGEPKANGRAACIVEKKLHLHDGEHHQSFTIPEAWQLSIADHGERWQPLTTSWRDCFPEGPPKLSPRQAFSSVLLYPEDSRMIGEQESQPFIFDYVDDFLEEQEELQKFRETADHILYAHCEISLGSCLRCGHPQKHTIWYEWPAFAQKQAQYIWNSLHRQKGLASLHNFQFLPIKQHPITDTYSPFDWMYVWIPFSAYENQDELRRWCWFFANNLVPGGIACVAGPKLLGNWFQEQRLTIVYAEQGINLPTFKIHQAILQHSQLHPELTLWIIQQS